MTNESDSPLAGACRRPTTRRSFLKSAAAVSIGAPFAGAAIAACDTAAPSKQLLIAAATTPPSLDWELVFGKEVYDHIFNLNDRLTRWKQIPAPGEPGGFDLAWQAENFDEITEPRMAEGWEVTNGGRTYTFSLRRGWPSHAGNEFTSADVKWAFDRSFALHGITSFYNTLSTIERPEDVKVLDKYTVRIELAEPGPDLLLTLSTFWRVIADSKLAKSHATSGDPWAKRWLRNHDAGFGPFKLADLSPGRHVVWAAHKEHPFPPEFDQITFQEVPESSNRLAMLMTGEAQVAQYLLPTDMQRVENGNDLRLWNFQGYVIASCPMNPKYPPLGDVRVRQALSYATPYPQILEKVYRGFAGPAHGPLSDHDAGFDPNLVPYSYDPGRARELLRESRPWERIQDDIGLQHRGTARRACRRSAPDRLRGRRSDTQARGAPAPDVHPSAVHWQAADVLPDLWGRYAGPRLRAGGLLSVEELQQLGGIQEREDRRLLGRGRAPRTHLGPASRGAQALCPDNRERCPLALDRAARLPGEHA